MVIHPMEEHVRDEERKRLPWRFILLTGWRNDLNNHILWHRVGWELFTESWSGFCWKRPSRSCHSSSPAKDRDSFYRTKTKALFFVDNRGLPSYNYFLFFMSATAPFFYLWWMSGQILINLFAGKSSGQSVCRTWMQGGPEQRKLIGPVKD